MHAYIIIVTSDSKLAIDLDDTGIYLVTRYTNGTFSLNYYEFNNSNGNNNIGSMGVTENTPRHILTTSPGTQPLPSKRKYTYIPSFFHNHL